MAVLTSTSPGLASQILAASNKTGTPTFVLASMYTAGFRGDPTTLATTLKKWFNATGGTSWNDTLAAYHAGSTTGILDPHAQAYAKSVLQTIPPRSLVGAMSGSDVLGLAGAELAGGLLSIAGAASATAAAAGAAGADAAATAGGAEAGAAGTAGGGIAGAIAKGAAKGVAGQAAKAGLAGLLGAGAWAEFGIRALQALAGAALILLGLSALTGGTGSPVEAVKKTAARMR